MNNVNELMQKLNEDETIISKDLRVYINRFKKVITAENDLAHAPDNETLKIKLNLAKKSYDESRDAFLRTLGETKGSLILMSKIKKNKPFRKILYYSQLKLKEYAFLVEAKDALVYRGFCKCIVVAIKLGARFIKARARNLKTRLLGD